MLAGVHCCSSPPPYPELSLCLSFSFSLSLSLFLSNERTNEQLTDWKSQATQEYSPTASMCSRSNDQEGSATTKGGTAQATNRPSHNLSCDKANTNDNACGTVSNIGTNHHDKDNDNKASSPIELVHVRSDETTNDTRTRQRKNNDEHDPQEEEHGCRSLSGSPTCVRQLMVNPTTTTTTTAAAAVTQQQQQQQRRVTFGHVDIREHSVTVGDHPYVSYPLSLDWKHGETKRYLLSLSCDHDHTDDHLHHDGHSVLLQCPIELPITDSDYDDDNNHNNDEPPPPPQPQKEGEDIANRQCSDVSASISSSSSSSAAVPVATTTATTTKRTTLRRLVRTGRRVPSLDLGERQQRLRIMGMTKNEILRMERARKIRSFQQWAFGKRDAKTERPTFAVGNFFIINYALN